MLYHTFKRDKEIKKLMKDKHYFPKFTHKKMLNNFKKYIWKPLYFYIVELTYFSIVLYYDYKLIIMMVKICILFFLYFDFN